MGADGGNIGGGMKTPRKIHPRALAALTAPPTPSTEGPYTPLKSPPDSSPDITPQKPLQLNFELNLEDSDSDEETPFHITFCTKTELVTMAVCGGR